MKKRWDIHGKRPHEIEGKQIQSQKEYNSPDVPFPSGRCRVIGSLCGQRMIGSRKMTNKEDIRKSH
ncbi:MAG: hypothetical protein LKG62_08585 [Solobacterium sp.]|nr:hypothetical protein [Solobacterium sp.]